MITTRTLTILLTYKISKTNNYDNICVKLCKAVEDKFNSQEFDSYMNIVTKETISNVEEYDSNIIDFTITMFISYKPMNTDVNTLAKVFIETNLEKINIENVDCYLIDDMMY